MTIDIEVVKIFTGSGECAAVDAQAIIMFSPREGFDADKIEALERDLGKFVGERLNNALKKGGTK